ncbi:hypothetical protein DLEV_089 [Diachasmimorpha longicaudata entomopoxvirus]|uniref:Uncharacterized protein n=1 Tax=Diachasmimorpha longicaudata entomopoxvirus TaxID=109981 RepID=A0A7R5WG31_9POXV|nr:hypothetical protein QKK69_gp089 [Diachasmimorpha longicaudata entomopoxvirus]AKS26380.1 hypothetical protein DLEV_089 [Diachasmimorpha longicaudata entomopoxvirus]
MILNENNYTAEHVVIVYTGKDVWSKTSPKSDYSFDINNLEATGWKKETTGKSLTSYKIINSELERANFYNTYDEIPECDIQTITTMVEPYFYIIPPLKELKNLTCHVLEIDYEVPRRNGKFELPRDKPDKEYYIVDFFEMGYNDRFSKDLQNVYKDLAEYRVGTGHFFKLPNISDALDSISKHSKLGKVILTYKSSEEPQTSADICFTNYFANIALDPKLVKQYNTS